MGESASDTGKPQDLYTWAQPGFWRFIFVSTWWFNPLLGQAPASAAVRAGEGLEVTLVHTWPWPPWVTLLVLIVAAAYVLLVYFREPGDVGRRTRLMLAGLRLGLIALVIVMMYGWMRNRHRTDLPDLVLVVDDSRSMEFADRYGDSRLMQRLRKRLDTVGLEEPSRINLAKSLLLKPGAGWLDRLREKYNLKLYFLATTARIQGLSADAIEKRVAAVEATQQSSRLGDGLQSILEAQRGRPTAAVVVLSDGVTTEGKSISEVANYARRKHIPLFLLGVGDERPPRDLRLSDLLVDEVVFLGDVVNFDFKLAGSGFATETVSVRLKRKGQDRVLAQRQVELDGDGTSASVRLALRATEQGDFEYVVEVEPLRNETNLSNNRLSQMVSVRDETIRVLYVQEYPSLEFRFLKTLLERQVKLGSKENVIQLTTVLQEADQGYTDLDETAMRVFPVSRDELFAYDVVIFGDVNPAYMSRPVLENLNAFVAERGGGVVFIAGPRHTPLAYRNTPLETLMPIELSTVHLPDEAALIDDSFSVTPTRLGKVSPQLQLAATPAESLDVWSKLPAIRWLLTAPDTRVAARVLVGTDPALPGGPRSVVIMQLVGAGRVIFHATDESYLWSRVDGSDQYYQRYWLQTIRYLSRAKLLGANRTVEVVPDRSQYYRGESVPLQVRFYDERMAPVADDGVVLLLERQQGRRQRINLQRDAVRRGVFGGTASNLTEGTYRVWVVVPRLDGKPPTWRFTVVPPPGEQAKLMMDAADLKQAAQTSEGKFYTLGSADRLLADLPQGRQVRIESLPPSPVWNSPWLAGLFVILLVTEWLGRKRVGWL